MKIKIINSFKMQWVDGYLSAFSGHDVAYNTEMDSPDAMVFMWCDEKTVNYINSSEKRCKYIVFIRRFEWYSGFWTRIDWKKVDAVIMVNDYLAAEFKAATGVTPHVIYNGVQVDKWKFRDREHGKNVAVVGYVNQKKNLPLAMQVLAALPEDYTLHIAGEVQDAATMDYIDNLARSLKRKVYCYGGINSDQIDLWLEDKDYILSTAISEGSPNNVIEAMAKGIMPVVHNWPGARQQFGPHVFDSVATAVNMIQHGIYNSEQYRAWVKAHFSEKNYDRLKEIVEGLWTT